MKILMVGDLHGTLSHAQYVARTAVEQKCDRIIQLGDFGYWPHYKDGQTYLNQLDLYANLKNITVYWVDGNHDKTSQIYQDHGADEDRDPEGFIMVRKQIRYAPRGHRWTWDGCRFIALGGAYSVDKLWRLDQEAKRALKKGLPKGSFAGTQWFPEEEMTDEDLERFLQDTTPVDVIVAHDKPRSSQLGWNRKDLSECWPNQDRLQRAIRVLNPAAFFHGHLHYYYLDTVRTATGDGMPQFTVVTGLDCDLDSASSVGYSKLSSWQVFDTDSVPQLRAAHQEMAEAWREDTDHVDDDVDAGAAV